MKIPSHIEICRMVDCRRLPAIPANCKRVYFGHETCEKLLPTFDEINNLLETAEKRQLKLTFVTPFLTERGMEKVQLFLSQLKSVNLTSFEIVSSDWGLIHWITQNKLGAPVISRFLTGQHVDFRTIDDESTTKEEIVLMDEICYKLRPKKKSPAMVEHFSSCTLIKDKTVEMLHKTGVTRFELSNVLQPIVLPDNPQCRYSLHTPFVPLTIFRSCPSNKDFNYIKKACNAHNCSQNRQKWQSGSSNRDLYCLDNALYYYHPDTESHLQQNDQIDRIVFHSIDI